MNKPITIIFQSEHIPVLMTALESYSRAKMGQFKTWLDETFNHRFYWHCGNDIEKFIRLRMIEQHLGKKHGQTEVAQKRLEYFFGVKDRIDPTNFLQYYAGFINVFPRTEDEPFPREINTSWGILHTEKVGDGQIAYEIYQTLRQYNAVTLNGGLFDHYTSTQDPLNYSGTDLPEIQDFVKHKDFRFNKTESRKLHKFCQKKDYAAAFGYINEVLKPKYKIPRGDSMKIQWETHTCDVSGMDHPKEDSYYLRVFRPKKEEKTEISSVNSLTEPATSAFLEK